MDASRYIVTKASDDGTFQVGDHIQMYSNGDIGCLEAQGYISSEDVPKAIKGIEYEIDTEWVDRKLKKLELEKQKLIKLKQLKQ